MTMMRMESPGWLVRLLMVVTVAAVGVRGHAMLTFPPARNYSLDYLLYAEPCGGVPAQSKDRTTFEAGSTVNVTWYMAFVHRGGYKLQLLAGNNVIAHLTPEGQWMAQDNGTTSWRLVTIPSMTCDNCVLRLLRQLAEHSQDTFFYSCSDIHIVPSFNEDCTGHGKYDTTTKTCTCDKLYPGDRCQYKEECSSDADCQNGGRCYSTGISTAPGQCYCPAGFYGPVCDKISPVTSIPTDMSSYEKATTMNDRYEMNYKILQASKELEVILKVRTTNWVGIGFRPSDITAYCKNFPYVMEKVAPEKIPGREPTLPKEQCSKTPSDPLHPMDCTDIVMGRARGMMGRVEDMYTRDRSSPRPDSFYGGQDDLTAALAYETDGYTWMLFRRKLQSNERSDHPITGLMQVNFAFGQDSNHTTSCPKAAVERGEASDKNYYKEDQFKYHGYGSSTTPRKMRGHTLIDFGTTITTIPTTTPPTTTTRRTTTMAVSYQNVPVTIHVTEYMDQGGNYQNAVYKSDYGNPYNDNALKFTQRAIDELDATFREGVNGYKEVQVRNLRRGDKVMVDMVVRVAQNNPNATWEVRDALTKKTPNGWKIKAVEYTWPAPEKPREGLSYEEIIIIVFTCVCIPLAVLVIVCTSMKKKKTFSDQGSDE